MKQGKYSNKRIEGSPMKKSFLSFVMLLFFVGTSSFAELAPQWVIDLHEAHTNDSMEYRLMRPLGFDPGRLYPVIVSLHSAPGVGTDNISNLRQWNTQLSDPQLRADYPAYVIAPQVTNGLWNSQHLLKIKNIITALPSVDMGRIYVLGQSLGGRGTHKMIQLDPKYFAAAAPVSGTPQGGATPIKDLPIWAFHGTADTTVPFQPDQDLFNEMVTVGGNMKFTTFIGMGHSTDDNFIPFVDVNSAKAPTYFSSTNRCDPEPVFMKWLFKWQMFSLGH